MRVIEIEFFIKEPALFHKKVIICTMEISASCFLCFVEVFTYDV